MDDRAIRAYIAEFVGTLVLVLFIGFVVTLNTGAGIGATDYAVIGLVHFFALAVLIVTLGGTSGGHFNPAVTVTIAALRKIKPADAVIYVLMQVAGAIVAALIIKVVLVEEVRDGAGAAAYGGVEISEKFLGGDVLPALVVRRSARSSSCGRSSARS